VGRQIGAGTPLSEAGIVMGWIADTNDRRVQAAHGWTCDVCNARIKHLCSNPIDPDKPLPGRVVHFARIVDRRREK
jgi:hypothetical protein